MSRRTVSPITLFLLLVVLIMGILLVRSNVSSEAGKTNANVNSAPPSSITFNYQGQLLDSSGNTIDRTVPMTFSLYDVATGGTACWTELHTTTVTDGVFTVLLGSITDIPDDCITGDTYLDITVDGEPLTPRELVNNIAQTLPDKAKTLGDLSINGSIHSTRYAEFGLQDNGGGRLIITNNSGDNKIFIEGYSSDKTGHADEMLLTGYQSRAIPLITLVADQTNIAGQLNVAGTIEGNTIEGSDIIVGNVRGHGDSDTRAQIHMPGGTNAGNMYLNWHTGGSLNFGGGTESTKFSVNSDGDGYFAGDLNIGGSCSASAGTHAVASNDATCTGGSITTGAVIEANLQTPEQMRSESIDQFEKGDLLCWNVEIEELALCDTESSPLIIAVANTHGKPIVMGAEPIKVTGDVKAGDFLVASDVPGRAMATDNPIFGIVIGQALQSSTADNTIILAMIGNK